MDEEEDEEEDAENSDAEETDVAMEDAEEDEDEEEAAEDGASATTARGEAAGAATGATVAAAVVLAETCIARTQSRRERGLWESGCGAAIRKGAQVDAGDGATGAAPGSFSTPEIASVVVGTRSPAAPASPEAALGGAGLGLGAYALSPGVASGTEAVTGNAKSGSAAASARVASATQRGPALPRPSMTDASGAEPLHLSSCSAAWSLINRCLNAAFSSSAESPGAAPGTNVGALTRGR